ncbi:MAG: hypothetical protein BWK76_14300 [Desulfobulbaceae bacterium A2]|nr:MAG: hypothetical protein BWK76_14300 [Desulfobulbaceae bacterium A2]
MNQQTSGDHSRKLGLIQAVLRFSWMLLLVLVAGSWYLLSWETARSVAIGGLVANGSFLVLGRDIRQFLENFLEVGGASDRAKRLEKVKFFLKFYGRLLLMAAMLFALFQWLTIDVLGLLIGLSTVMLSVIAVVLSKPKLVYAPQFQGE